MRNTIVLTLLSLFLISGSVAADVPWVKSLEEGKALAQEQNKLILADFWAWWCGPCKKMDAEVWSQPEVIDLAGRFVPVKVDIEVDRNAATRYGANAIPMIVIMDPYGDVIYENTGYMTMSVVKDLLKSFPAGIDGLQEAMKAYSQDYKDPRANFDLGLGYQLLARDADGMARRSFLYKSDDTFKSAEKYASKDDDKALAGQAEMMLFLNEAYWGKPGKAIKQFEKKKGMDEVLPENRVVAWYILCEAALEEGDKKTASKYYDKLREAPESEKWIAFIDERTGETP